MKLIDILSILVDNSYINVLDLDDNIIAQYNGWDSIPTEYNNNTVLEMYINNNILNIVIDL